MKLIDRAFAAFAKNIIQMTPKLPRVEEKLSCLKEQEYGKRVGGRGEGGVGEQEQTRQTHTYTDKQGGLTDTHADTHTHTNKTK